MNDFSFATLRSIKGRHLFQAPHLIQESTLRWEGRERERRSEKRVKRLIIEATSKYQEYAFLFPLSVFKLQLNAIRF